MNRAKITVAIPTINGRSTYLASCLKTCVSQDDDHLEILVSDNPGGAAREVVAGLGDKRIRYVRPPRYLPMAAHWDFVLSQISGEVFTIIGDDDGLMPECILRLRSILDEAGLAPIQHSLCNYTWPDFVDSKRRNRVDFFHPVGKHCTLIDSSSFLCGVARGTQRYVDGPMVYHNFIPTALVRMLSKDGVFFRRSAPDVYSAVALAANTEKYFSSDEVLTISGVGAKSNGAAFMDGRADKFFSEMMNLYRPRFPGRSIQMMLLDSLFEVAERFSRPELLEDVDFAEHFMLALKQSRGNGMKIYSPEFRNILAAAAKWGVGAKVIFELASLFVSKATRANTAPSVSTSAARTHLFEAGDVLQLDIAVKNIYDASLAVSKALAGAKPSPMAA